MNLIEYLYPLVCNDLNFILFLTILINFLMFFLLQVINTLAMTFGMSSPNISFTKFTSFLVKPEK